MLVARRKSRETERRVRKLRLTISKDLLLEGGEDDEGDNSSRELTPSLRGEDGGHHASTDASSSELGGDGSRERVVASNAQPHFVANRY